MKKNIQRNESAVSPVLGAILILAIGVTLLSTVQLNFVPVWNTQEELDHLKLMLDDFKVLKSGIESGIQSGSTSSLPLSMGFKYSPKMLVYNPKESAYASLDIQENTWAEVRYNEVFPDGMTDYTSIKNVTTSTITYALKGGSNYNAFIYEHGLIRRNGSDYTVNSETVLANNTVNLLSVKPLGSETTSSVEKKTVNIYPTSQQKNSVIGKNVWLILHTKPDYVNWWKSSLESEGEDVKKADNETGIVVAYIDSAVIKMGEAYISTAPKAAPAHAPPFRIVKVTPENTYLPVDGITNLIAEIQDYYNNPISNLQVNFAINTTGGPDNAYSTANLSQSSAISGTDGRANIQLITSGSGLYYIDASLSNPAYTTTFVFPASSQNGFISLAYTESFPDYTVTATLKDGFGQLMVGNNISFSAGSNATVTPPWNLTDSNGKASTTLNTSHATGMKPNDIQVTDITNSSATIAWNTVNTITVAANRTPGGYIFNSINIPVKVNTTGCVNYGTVPGNYPMITCDSQQSYSHNISLSLLSNTVYYFIVNSSGGRTNVNSTEYMFVTGGISGTVPPVSITNLSTSSIGPLYVNWTWTDPNDIDFDHVQVYIDGTYVGDVAAGVRYFNATYFMPNSTHEISTRTADTSGNVNTTWVNNTANTSSLFTYVFDFDLLNATGSITNFSNAQNATDGGASATISEAINTNISMQYRWMFNSTTESWVSNFTTTGGGVTMNFVGIDGNPPGSIYSTFLGDNSGAYSAATTWTSPNFTWTNGTPLSARLDFDWRVASYNKANAGNYYVILVKPDGSNSQIYPTTVYSGTSPWSTYSNTTILANNFVQNGNYSLKLVATLNTQKNGANPNVAAGWDNPSIVINSSMYRLNITTNTTDITDAPNMRILQIRYNVSNNAAFILQIWNGSIWINKTTLNSTSWDYRNISLSSSDLMPNGAVTGGSIGSINKYYLLVRYVDANASAIQGSLYLDYQRVYSS